MGVGLRPPLATARLRLAVLKWLLRLIGIVEFISLSSWVRADGSAITSWRRLMILHPTDEMLAYGSHSFGSADDVQLNMKDHQPLQLFSTETPTLG
jgi:hypothetical protein